MDPYIGALGLAIAACFVTCLASIMAARAFVAASEARRLARNASNDVDTVCQVVGAMKADVLELLEWRIALVKIARESREKEKPAASPPPPPSV